MINNEEIKEKKRLYLAKLKEGNLTDEENDNYRSSLLCMISILRQNRDLLNVKLHSIKNFFRGNMDTMMSMVEDGFISSGITNKYKLEIDDDYLYYLLQLMLNVKDMEIDKRLKKYKKMDISDEQVVELTKRFYNWLDNDEINVYAQKILNDPSHYSFTAPFIANFKYASGITFYDSITNEVYILNHSENNIRKLHTFIHEIAHGVDFYTKPYLSNDKYRLIAETIPCTIEYLSYDFFNELGIDETDIDTIKEARKKYIKDVANDTYKEICLELLNKLKIRRFTRENIKDINNVINHYIIKDLMSIESRIVAYGLYKQIIEDKEVGLNNICKLIKNKIQDIPPDFSFIGLDRNKILELSRELGNSYSNTNKRRR